MKIMSRKSAKEQNLKRYYNGKPCKKGHTDERFTKSSNCLECLRLYSLENKEKTAMRQALYNEANKHDRREKAVVYRNANRDERLLKKKEYYNANKDKARIYREANKEKREVYLKDNADELRLKYKEYYESNKTAMIAKTRRYNKNNPLNSFTRNSLRRIESAKGAERIDRAEVELGYTQAQFVQYIESQFTDGMSWDNRSEWHIDHIVPLSWWLNEGITDVSRINALINLQPLWAYDNLKKSNKLL